VTHNQGKVREVRAALETIGWELEHVDLEYEEIQADTLEEVARKSISVVAGQLKRPCLLEDAGLFVDALHGFPGVYSAYVLRSIGCEGLLRLMQGQPNRSARFRSMMAYWPGEGEPLLFSGASEGLIAEEIRGGGGFGFDPVFISTELEGGVTFAEVDTATKNTVNHRARSLTKLIGHLSS